MAIITVGTNSYVTEAELTTYATDRGIAITANTSVLLIKAMDWLEVQLFKGTKTVYNQALQFPRILCGYSNPYLNTYYNNGFRTNYYLQPCEYDSETVPNEIKKAQILAALLIDGGNDLQPVVDRSVKREKIDVIEVEYMDNANSTPQYSSLISILRPFVKSGYTIERV